MILNFGLSLRKNTCILCTFSVHLAVIHGYVICTFQTCVEDDVFFKNTKCYNTNTLYMYFLFCFFVLYCLSTVSYFLIYRIINIFVERQSYEAPHCAVSCRFLLLSPSWILSTFHTTLLSSTLYLCMLVVSPSV